MYIYTFVYHACTFIFAYRKIKQMYIVHDICLLDNIAKSFIMAFEYIVARVDILPRSPQANKIRWTEIKLRI